MLQVDASPVKPLPDADAHSNASEGSTVVSVFDDSAYSSDDAPLLKDASRTCSVNGQQSESELDADLEVRANPILWSLPG